jgi:hypothetical protein
MADKNPALGAKSLEQLNKTIASCMQTRELCNKCKAAMLDVAKEQAENEEQLTIATKLKEQFFPMER